MPDPESTQPNPVVQEAEAKAKNFAVAALEWAGNLIVAHKTAAAVVAAVVVAFMAGKFL